MKKHIPLNLHLLIILFLANLGCATLQNTFENAFQTERIVPVFDPEATILMRSGSAAYIKNGITAIAVPLNDVKAVDAFGIIVFNSTDHWISLRQDIVGIKFCSPNLSQGSFAHGKMLHLLQFIIKLR